MGRSLAEKLDKSQLPRPHSLLEPHWEAADAKCFTFGGMPMTVYKVISKPETAKSRLKR
jgi:hypothetical protein